jgi:hypothetical protein
VARSRAFRPFAGRGRRAIGAILVTFALSSTVTVLLSIWAISRAQGGATTLEVAARQRMLADRYVGELLLVRSGAKADPASTAAVLRRSADVLLDGGRAPAVNGDDDEEVVPAARCSPAARCRACA